MKYRVKQLLLAVTMGVFLLTGCGASEEGAASQEAVTEEAGEMEDVSSQIASAEETTTKIDVVEDGMVPIYGESVKDGTYDVIVDSSSSMFKIFSCELNVADGQMTATMKLEGDSYTKVFPGTGMEAVKASEDAHIPAVEQDEYFYTFTIPVEALDEGVDCAAFSRRKEKWYERTLVFRADSLPLEAFDESMVTTVESLALEDGFYTAEVTLGGGSGRAMVESPTQICVENGQAYATITWGSPNYDYMKIDGEKYLQTNTEGNSTFEIPVKAFDWNLAVIADTIAMSQPHEISYTLYFDSETLTKTSVSFQELTLERSLELEYAEQFSVDYYEGGYAMIDIQDSGRYFVVPEEAEVPADLDEDITVLNQPLDHIYMVATSAMDLFRVLDGIGNIRLSGTDIDGWYIEEAKHSLEAGDMLYAGKYNAPDYELILSEGCDLALESTMIYHTPEVKEQLERFDIPVMVERSSYENHPLARMEWLKLYGVLLDKEDMAEQIFDKKVNALSNVLGAENTGKTVAFFYINSNGIVNVRKSSDYVPRMIEMAGGKYIFEQLGDDNDLSTINMEMEAFYSQAREADYLIYNSTIDAEITTIEELLGKSELLSDFKAVKEGNVYCAQKNLFQESMGLGTLITDIHQMLTEDDPQMTYLYKLQ